jgi:glutamate racemase
MIGIFDSGIGGLTVVRAFMTILRDYDIIYFGDTARTPYGNKSERTVLRYAQENIDFLLHKGAQIIITACNTAASVLIQAPNNSYNIPMFEVITPAVRLSVEASKNRRIGVIGTRATITSGIYEKKIHMLNSKINVYSASCPLLVPLVEEAWLTKPETTMIVKKYLHPLKVRQIDTLILGCTHYPILKKIIHRKIGKKVDIIDSSLAVANQVKNFLKANPESDLELKKNGNLKIFVSDVTEQFQKTAREILKKNISLEHLAI